MKLARYKEKAPATMKRKRKSRLLLRNGVRHVGEVAALLAELESEAEVEVTDKALPPRPVGAKFKHRRSG